MGSVVAVAIFLGCVPAPPAAEEAPEDEYVEEEPVDLATSFSDPTVDRIVFSAAPSGTGPAGREEIYSIFTNGSGIRTLTQDDEVDYRPRWSPDGLFIADNCGLHVCTMEFDGSGKTQISGGTFVREMEPEWSPDGRFVVWTGLSAGDQRPSLHLTEIATGEITLVDADPNNGFMPTWCEAGLVWVRDLAAAVGVDRELFLLDDDGVISQLTNGDDSPADPEWSPDCTKIAYHTYTAEGINKIKILDLASKGITTVDTPTGIDARHPTWSPDMTSIAFSGTTSRSSAADIYVADPNNTFATMNITLSTGLHEQVPDWGTPPINVFFGDLDVTVTEFAGSTALTVRLSAPSSQPVTVDISTINSSATAGSDYQAVNRTLTFSPGETSITVQVPIINDSAIEPNEIFFVGLSKPTNVFIYPEDFTATVTITDDDQSGPPPPPTTLPP